MKSFICILFFAITILAPGCISQYISFPDKIEISETTNTNTLTRVDAGSTNLYYKASGGIIISMGIYSVKNVNPNTSATIPLK